MQDEEKQVHRTTAPSQRHTHAVSNANIKKSGAANLYLSLAAAALAALGSLLSVNVFFNLSPTGLSIKGSSLYEPQQIQQVSGLMPGQNLVRLNTEYVRARLKDNLVYVDDVTVTKNYPSGLEINIKEAVPQIQLDEGGVYYTISRSGRVLEAKQTERIKKLPLVVGYDLKNLLPGKAAESKDEQKTKILKSLLKEIKRLDFKKIVKIDITDRTDIKLVYDGRLELQLGSSVDLDIKLANLKAVIDADIPKSYEGTLRYNGIESGISARPKKVEVPKAAVSSGVDSSSLTDSSQAETYDPNGGYTQPDTQNTTPDTAYPDTYTDPNGGYYGGDGGYAGGAWDTGYSDGTWNGDNYTVQDDYGYNY